MSRSAKHTCKFVAIAILALGLACHSASAADITGAGSTFVSPVLAKWIEAYRQRTGHSIVYRPIGSGSGAWLIRNRMVDFALSDVGLSAQQLASDNLIQFPLVIGAVVPVFNLRGIASGQLKLTGPVLADIYLGKISRWNDQRIARINPGVTLPDKPIFSAHRAEESGTKTTLYEYLAKNSSEWRRGAPPEITMLWPYDRNGNEHVVAFVSSTDGAIGYVEYAYAKQNHLTYALMKNDAGEYVAPNDSSFRSAVASTNLLDAGILSPPRAPLVDLTGERSWPVLGVTYAIVYKTQERSDAATALLRFFDWIYHDGSGLAGELDYAAIPPDVVRAVESNWSNIRTPAGEAVWRSSRR